MATKREIVIDTINNKRHEALPYYLDLTDMVRDRLIDYFNDPDFESKVGNYLAQERNESFEELDHKRKKDMFGVVWSQEQEGDFGIVEEYILKESNFDNYTFPEPDEELIREKCEKLVSEENEDLFKLYIIGFSLFERAWSLRGMENLLMDFILNPDFANELLDKITEYNIKVMDIVFEYPLDSIFFGDDWGQQKGLIMGPKIWRKFLKPRLAKMYSKAKNEGFYVTQHSCGDIHDVFPDLVEIGLDVYNTFQPEVYDIKFMKEEYGKDITFYGGVSTQQLLPNADPEKVKSETKRLMKIIGEDGGYIVAPTHSIPNDVPTENILAFLEVVQNQ